MEEIAFPPQHFSTINNSETGVEFTRLARPAVCLGVFVPSLKQENKQQQKTTTTKTYQITIIEVLCPTEFRERVISNIRVLYKLTVLKETEIRQLIIN